MNALLPPKASYLVSIVEERAAPGAPRAVAKGREVAGVDDFPSLFRRLHVGRHQALDAPVQPLGDRVGPRVGDSGGDTHAVRIGQCDQSVYVREVVGAVLSIQMDCVETSTGGHFHELE
jgi:hypothetical protein